MRRKIRTTKRRKVRHVRIRAKISGTTQRPRLCVHRSLKHFEAQLIDDIGQKTLVSASTRDKEVRKTLTKGGNVNAAKALGAIVAERAKSKGFDKVVMDRSGYMYGGRLKAFADAAREKGLNF